MRRVVIAAGLAALVLGGAQSAHAGIALNTIDRHVTSDEDVRSSGPIACTRGERIVIKVRVSQTSGARARGRWSGRCTGDRQRWRVRARAQERFASGPARVCAVARTRADGRVTDERRWCRRVSVASAAGAWGASVRLDLGARELGLSSGASNRALARAAISRVANRLGLPRHGGLRFAFAGAPGGTVEDARTLEQLRFQQTLGGVRVLWSDINVAVSDGRVRSISATTVPVTSSRLTGRGRLSSRRAVAIARRAVAGPDRALPAQPVAHAGAPGKPRPARRAYVVQVTPEKNLERNLCVVVDAETGEVLAVWRGTAALPRSRPPASLAQGTTVLFQLTNFKRQPGENGYAYGKLRQLVSTTGFPSSYRTDINQFFDVFDQRLAWLAPWLEDVTRFFCLTRKYCGRDSAGDGTYNRWFVVGNYGSEDTAYSYGDEHVLIGADDADDPDVIAHEIGHAIDHHFDGGEYQKTIEGEEVKEALADMFAYDQDRDGKLQDGKNPSTPAGSNPDDGDVVRDFANPANADDAAKYSQYDCFTADDHDNGTILSHAYHRFVTKAGHAKAGHVLQYVPWQLPARREFGDVRVGFENAARGLFPNGGKYEGSVEQKIDQAFDEVGVFAATRRTSKCKGAKP